MSFDYFNTSHLAFGSKLTRAFRQLENLLEESGELISGYANNLEYLSQFVNKNYRVPFPLSGENPVQVAQLLDVINDEINIKELSFDGTNLSCSIAYFNRGTNRFTIASGTTTIKKGYAYFKESVSNTYPNVTITFKEDKDTAGLKLLFQYRIDSQNRINIIKNDSSLLKLKIGGIDHITSMRIGGEITLPHTAEDYEAIIVEGNSVHNGDSVNLIVTKENNNNQISSSTAAGTTCKRWGIVYLKPNEVLSSPAYYKAYKIIYE